MIPMYKNLKNSPFIPNEQKEIFRDRMEEKHGKQYPQTQSQPQSQYPQNPQTQSRPQYQNKRTEQQPLVDLQVYEPSTRKPSKRPTTDPALYVPITTQNP